MFAGLKTNINKSMLYVNDNGGFEMTSKPLLRSYKPYNRGRNNDANVMVCEMQEEQE